MQKYYEVKLYDWQGNFKKQISSKNITSDIFFSENINGTQGDLTLDIVGDEADFKESDIIEIRESIESIKSFPITADTTLFTADTTLLTADATRTQNVFPTYTGIIERKSIQEYKYSQVLGITLLWVWTALNDIIYKNWSSKVFTKTDTFGNIAKSIIDYFNTQYGTLEETQNLWTSMFWYDTDSIDTTGITAHINFDHDNCYKALEKLTKDTDFFFFIEPTGKVTFKKTNTLKILTFERELVSIERKTKKDEMVNKLYLHRTSGHWNEEIYNNFISQAEYGFKELHEDRTDIQNKATQDEIWAIRVEEFGYPREETTLKIKAQKSDFLFPWMEVTTQNTKNPLVASRVTKIDKRKDIWTLYIWDYTSFWKVFLQR